MLQLRELREFALHYISARADRTRLKVREQGMRFALAAIGLVALSGLIVAAVCCLVNGMAGGLAVMFGDRAWAGNLTAGVVLLGVMALGIWFVWNKQLKGSRESAVTKYEARRTRQRAEFGHAVGDSSASGDVPL
jgi:hypothetical protein